MFGQVVHSRLCFIKESIKSSNFFFKFFFFLFFLFFYHFFLQKINEKVDRLGNKRGILVSEKIIFENVFASAFKVLNETLTRDPSTDLTDGRSFANQFLGRSFRTNVGEVSIDEHGLRKPSVSLQYFDAETGFFKVPHDCLQIAKEFPSTFLTFFLLDL
jgi:hypothetical protein